MKSKTARIVGILLSLALMLGMMGALSATAYTDDYDLWVGGIQVTSANADDVLADDEMNKGKVSFTPAKGETPATLTLKGANITAQRDRSWINTGKSGSRRLLKKLPLNSTPQAAAQ